MNWFGDLRQCCVDRKMLTELRLERDRHLQTLHETIDGLKQNSDEYRIAVADYFASVDVVEARMAEIETAQTLRRAEKWRIPTPQRPYKEDEHTDFWQWHAVHGRYYVTDEAMRRVRREVYEEREMFLKPWLTWFAVLISVISLAVSALKL
ncbi:MULTISPECIES: hypothetical protein [unclassified Mesorhizobium]|uniref:hypothetical protein n=1 Tax=unclassified Mesorhizobium TaxID=325217 RepID=UPI000FD7AFF1|nr:MULTISPECIES: hypothetical protein [unclassified Mesorhizobium]TGQ12132.1 hypothetical protein EN862_014590 [Mesorhizobium sp. M2E.F.Ca.ET.219.01.1.1]TGT67954.1 hypothetical protein EN809_025855 [Mesorhizobium sp. M2E.F.Ca.ET.166.01.1.1]TGW00955.1 hypothetical protein EN797_011165 [Mesorhizobium sp. M2E.F.Ca.ET.154.01.1.1]